MIIYTDPISGDELFSDAFEICCEEGGVLKIVGKLITVKEGEVDIGANPSADEPSEQLEEGSISGLDVALAHNYVEMGEYTKKDFKAAFKTYMQAIKQKMGADELDEEMKTNCLDFVKNIAANIKDYSFYVGESMNPEGLIIPVKWLDEKRAEFFYLKYGLIQTKC